MNDTLDVAVTEPKPEFWYGLPHGYRRVDLHPTPEGLAEVARLINGLPEAARDRAEQVLRLYAVVVKMMRRQQVQGCALGMHPDDSGGAALSVLTVSTVPMPGANPKLVLTNMLADDAGAGTDEGILPVELPAGTGFLSESVRKTVAPGTPVDGEEGPRKERVWQGTVAIPNTGSSSVVTVQLVTPAVGLAHDYRGVLLGVARTLTFTDPAAQSGTEQHSGPEVPGSVADTIRDVFG